MDQGRYALAVLSGASRGGTRPVDPPEGVPPRTARRRVSDPLLDDNKRAALAIAQRVRESLGLSGERGSSDVNATEDAGVIRFKQLRPVDAWALRVRVGQAISDLHPAARAKLVELRTSPRDPSTLEPKMVGNDRR